MTAERIQALDGIGFEGETNVSIYIYIYIYIHIHVYIYIIIKSFVDYLAIKRI
jgi:hypothetical protein